MILDCPSDVMLEPVIAQQRSASEMSRGPSADATGLWLVPRAGWIISPAQRSPSRIHLESDLQASVLGPSDGSVPSAWSQEPRFSQLSAAGIDYGSQTVTSGDLFWVKSVGASEDWSGSSCQLTADASAYPGPDWSSQAVPVDRVFASSSTYGPDDGLVVRLDLPGSKIDGGSTASAIYFCGPAGLTEGGIGQYCLALDGDGLASLYESNSTAWTLAASHPIGSKVRQSRTAQYFHIHPSTKTLDPSLAGVIVIEFELAPSPAPAHAPSAGYTPPPADIRQWAIPVPKGGGTSQPCAWRLDLRRDLRASWQISRLTYPYQEVLQDDAFALPFFPSSEEPLILAWFCDVPDGCHVTGELLDALTLSPLTPSGQIAGFPEYAITPPLRQLIPRFTLTSDAPQSGSYGTHSPTLFGWRVQRDGFAAASTLTPVELSGTVRAEIHDEAPDAHRARLTIQDVTGDAASHLTRGQRRIRIETEYDPAHPELRAALFQGEVGRPVFHRSGYAGSVYPASQWDEIELNAVGMSQRLSEAVFPIRFDFSLDFNSLDADGHPMPFLVTDALKTLFAACGFSESQLAFDASPARLFGSCDPQGLVLEPQARAGDVIVRWCREYLNSFPYFDAIAGVWRLASLTPDTSPVATFTTSGPSAGKAVHMLESYPPATAPIRKGSLTEWTDPPAVSVVIACGIAAGPGSSPCLMEQVLVNPDSLAFAGSQPDPDGIDFLERAVPYFACLPAIGTPDGLNWMARRIYDEVCHGRKGCSWQSPLLLVQDEESGNGDQMRTLRPGDPVSVAGSLMQLQSVKPIWTKDDHQLCDYEAVQILS